MFESSCFHGNSYFPQGFLSFLSFVKMAMEKKKLEKTLDQVTVANHASVEVPLRVVSVTGPKKIGYGKDKTSVFFKSVVRFVDKKQNGLYAEARHGDQKEADTFCKKFEGKKCFMLQDCNMASTKWFAGFHVDLSTKQSNKIKFVPILMADPHAVALADCFPESRTNFKDLLDNCQGYERVDLMGKLMENSLKEVASIGKEKSVIWLKDNTNNEVQVTLWGKRFCETAKNLQCGDILQVDNAVMLKQKDNSVEASAEHFLDNDKHTFANLHVNQGSKKFALLQDLSDERGRQISSAWQAASARRDVLRAMINRKEAFVGCCSTLRTCSLELQEDSPDFLEVVLHSIWVTAVHGEISFRACVNCGTKIDEKNACKKAATGCRTSPKDQDTLLAQIDMADFSGKLEKVLVTEPELLALARAKDPGTLLGRVAEHGPMCVCFQGQFDCRLVTQRGMRQWRAGRSGGAAVEDLQHECQFQVLSARFSLGRAVDTTTRPMVRKILRVEGERAEGAVLPVVDLYSDLNCSSGMGLKFLHATVFPDLVLIVAKATDEPAMSTIGEGDASQVSIRHEKVWPLRENGDAETSGRPFVMEAMTSFQKSVMYNMMDGQARCLIGRPIVDDTSGEITFMTEKMFPLKDLERKALQTETREVWALLCNEQTVESGAKRPAGALVTETPAKVKAPRWTATP